MQHLRGRIAKSVYVRTYASSTVSRHFGAETKNNIPSSALHAVSFLTTLTHLVTVILIQVASFSLSYCLVIRLDVSSPAPSTSLCRGLTISHLSSRIETTLTAAPQLRPPQLLLTDYIPF